MQYVTRFRPAAASGFDDAGRRSRPARAQTASQVVELRVDFRTFVPGTASQVVELRVDFRTLVPGAAA